MVFEYKIYNEYNVRVYISSITKYVAKFLTLSKTPYVLSVSINLAYFYSNTIFRQTAS